MGKECNLSIQPPKPSDKAVGTVGNLGGRFTPRATIPKDIPIGPLLADVWSATSFVIAIIPFSQIRFNFKSSIRRNQSACPLRSLTRATEDADESDVLQPFSKLKGFLLAMFGQRNICSTSVLVAQRPGGFAVTNEVKIKGHLWCLFDLYSFELSMSRVNSRQPTGPTQSIELSPSFEAWRRDVSGAAKGVMIFTKASMITYRQESFTGFQRWVAGSKATRCQLLLGRASLG
jgi:hypothetical protein